MGGKRSQRDNSKERRKQNAKKKLKKFQYTRRCATANLKEFRETLEGKDTAICICGPKDGQWRKEYRKKLRENRVKQSSTSSPNIGMGTTPSGETKQVESNQA
ncbi:hypothetical protein CEXT_787491 [Caerostris extrusa]|uniref:Uncharacterized protein n=1 Tax=Caerostris extrusa TaxID=172846 RepID=A0AAV4VNH2_CAEEX|nr:hypothetical protein CEXT_787491 [Caerostris extrusa]